MAVDERHRRRSSVLLRTESIESALQRPRTGGHPNLALTIATPNVSRA